MNACGGLYPVTVHASLSLFAAFPVGEQSMYGMPSLSATCTTILIAVDLPAPALAVRSVMPFANAACVTLSCSSVSS